MRTQELEAFKIVAANIRSSYCSIPIDRKLNLASVEKNMRCAKRELDRTAGSLLLSEPKFESAANDIISAAIVTIRVTYEQHMKTRQYAA